MLSSKYPEYIETAKNKYKLNTDFRVALECFKICDDDSIDDYERTLAVAYMLLGDIPLDDLNDIMPLLQKYLSCGENEKEEVSQTRDMDLIYDSKYIEASFMSDYKIDLSRIDYLHWWQFVTLIGGMTNDCILNRVREIRTCDLKDFKGKARTKMAKAKEQLALPPRKNRLSQEEMDALEAFDAQLEANTSKQGNEIAKNEQL